MAERCVKNKDSHGHKYNTMDLLNSSEQAQDQSSAMVRTASSFSQWRVRGRGPALRGGRFTLTREKFRRKIGRLENGVKFLTSPNGRMETRYGSLVLTYTWLLSRGAAAGAIARY